jgi:hypothetical protein
LFININKYNLLDKEDINIKYLDNNNINPLSPSLETILKKDGLELSSKPKKSRRGTRSLVIN